MNSAAIIFASFAAALPAAGADHEPLRVAPGHRAVPGHEDIVDTAIAAGSFKTLAKALQAAGLVSTLKGRGPFTVFAPTDAAFARLPRATLEELLRPENRERLRAVLTYHVVAGKLGAKDVVRRTNATTVNGQRIDIMAGDRGVSVDDSRVLETDIICTNGVIHVIDSVLVPADLDLVGVAKKAGTFNTLLRAAVAAGLAEALVGKGPFTVFAPTDEAFGKLPGKTLRSPLEPASRSEH